MRAYSRTPCGASRCVSLLKNPGEPRAISSAGDNALRYVWTALLTSDSDVKTSNEKPPMSRSRTTVNSHNPKIDSHQLGRIVFKDMLPPSVPRPIRNEKYPLTFPSRSSGRLYERTQKAFGAFALTNLQLGNPRVDRTLETRQTKGNRMGGDLRQSVSQAVRVTFSAN